MAFPRLIDLVPVPTGQDDPLAGACPVMSDFRQAKLIPRFLLTWAAATHWPRFLNPEHALSAHTGQVLDLPGELRVFRELLVDRHAMCRVGAAPVAHAAVIGRTVPHGAANVAVLCECWRAVQRER